MWSIQSSIFCLFRPAFFKNRGTGFCARFSCGECPKSLGFSMVLRDSKYQVLLRYARMCNRFEITRNQVVRKGTWVRIPPAPPRRSKLYIACSDFFTKVRARSCRCSSFPNRTRCAGLRFGFGCRPKSCASKVFALSTSRTSYRSRRLFILKSHRSITPSLLLSNRDSLRWIRGWVWVRGGKSMPQKRSRLCSKNLRLAGGFCCIENRTKTQNAGRTASPAA